MNTIRFAVEKYIDGGLIARAIGESIFTQADYMSDLHQQINDAVICHFNDGKSAQKIILC